MFVILWRYGPQTEWNAHPKLIPSEQGVRSEINKLAQHNLETSGRREYRFQPIGEASTWHDPYAEQAAREAKEDI